MPLILALALISLMTSWKRGRDLLLARWQQDSLPLALLHQPAPAIARHHPGAGHGGVPDRQPRLRAAALLHNLKHNKVLHETVLFVTVQNIDVPEADPESGRKSRSSRQASTASSCAMVSRKAPISRGIWSVCATPASPSTP